MKTIRSFAPLAALVLAACMGQSEDPESGTIDGMTVNNRESSFSGRVASRNQDIALSGTAKTAAAEKTLTLTLVAEIAPPVIEGEALEATSVDIKANFAFVSYASPGIDRFGAIESIHLKAGKNAVLRSQVLFDDVDVWSVFHDKDIYLAGTTSDSAFPHRAHLERVTEHGGKFALRPRERVTFSGGSATSVAVSGDRVYVTTSDSGGLYALSLDGLSVTGSASLPGARWVDADGSRVAVVRGYPGRLSLFGFGADLRNEWTFVGADSANEKNTVRLIGDKALIAAGSGGVRLVDVSSGKTLGIAPVPAGAGGHGARAADARGDLVYAAYGPAGVYVYRTSSTLDSATGETEVTFTPMGRFVLDGASAEHVAFDGNTLVVASGTGGVKVVSVRWRNVHAN